MESCQKCSLQSLLHHNSSRCSFWGTDHLFPASAIALEYRQPWLRTKDLCSGRLSWLECRTSALRNGAFHPVFSECMDCRAQGDEADFHLMHCTVRHL